MCSAPTFSAFLFHFIHIRIAALESCCSKCHTFCTMATSGCCGYDHRKLIHLRQPGKAEASAVRASLHESSLPTQPFALNTSPALLKANTTANFLPLPQQVTCAFLYDRVHTYFWHACIAIAISCHCQTERE